MRGSGAQKCREMLARNNGLAKIICAPDFGIETFALLQAWQRRRLADSFSDFMVQKNSRPACHFFLSELYGGLDFPERDQAMEKVMPVMVRLLSNNILLSLAHAFELQAISLEFDLEMARIVAERGLTELDVSSYALVYRACGNRPLREKQILLIQQLGFDLARLVDKRWVSRLVFLLRGPARAAGFGKLQEFFENGLRAFRKLESRDDFIQAIYEREWQTMQKLFDGNEHPFLNGSDFLSV
jgi:hypothetical protein